MTHDEATEVRRGWLRNAALWIGPAAAFATAYCGEFDPSRPEVGRTAAVAVWMAIWWVSEAVPLAATSLLPVVLLPALGVLDGKAVATEYFNHVVLLFLGGFVVALAIERWRLHKRIALRILLLFGDHPILILLGFMSATAFLSMWISNTAATMMMVTIVLAIIVKMEESAEGAIVARFSTGLLLGVAYGASIGGIATLVGTPPNLSFVRILERLHPDAPEVSFATWIQFGLPIAVVMLLLAWGILSWLFAPKRADLSIDREILVHQHRELGAPSYEEKVVFSVFVVLVLSWLFRADLDLGPVQVPGWASLFPRPEYINDGTVAIAAALLLFVLPSKQPSGTRLMEWHTAKKLPWHILLLFGGGFALATACSASGLSEWLGEQLKHAAPDGRVQLVSLICIAVTFLTEFTSNTATTEMLLPVTDGLARSLGMNPLYLMVPVTISCSFAFMMPVATPPNAIVFGSERVRIIDMVRAGLLLNLAGAVLIVAAIELLGGLVFDIDPNVVPPWAR